MPRKKKTIQDDIHFIITAAIEDAAFQAAERVYQLIQEHAAQSFNIPTGQGLVAAHVASLVEEAAGTNKKVHRRRSRVSKSSRVAKNPTKVKTKTKKVATKKVTTKKAASKKAPKKKLAKKRVAKPKAPATTNGARAGYAAFKDKVLKEADA